MRIVMAARLMLARSITVAIRYCSVRRQFRPKGDNGAEKLSVLNYPTVQIRLFPPLATVFAHHYSGEYMGKVYTSTRGDIENRGDMSTLANLHSMSSGLKGRPPNFLSLVWKQPEEPWVDMDLDVLLVCSVSRLTTHRRPLSRETIG